MLVHCLQSIGNRVRQQIVLQIHRSVRLDALPIINDYLSRNPNHGAVWRHTSQHHRAGTYFGVIADNNVAQYLGSGTDDHIIADGRMTLAFLFAGSAEGHALIQCDIVTNFSCLPYNYTGSVVNEKAIAYCGSRMNLN